MPETWLFEPPTRRSRPSAADRQVADDPLATLAERLQRICVERGLTVAAAESCTGGLVAAAITDVAGSSGYFLGGVVAYADATKRACSTCPLTFSTPTVP